ncbi:MAG: hypothetical protein IPM18_05075 [Phycisphaerales bacterium]|nr:hypothetical protein [Phycisphaerales bacterium]
MRRLHTTLLRTLPLAALLGTCFQGGCGVLRYVNNFNPCGTILNCDPVAYRFITSGYQGPGVNIDIDPACTFPPFCDGDPFVGGGGAGG